MRCVKCDNPIPNLHEPCPKCHFHGDPVLVEELLHIQWLLTQEQTLRRLGVYTVGVAKHYQARRRELQVQLGLRLASPTPQQAREMQIALVHNQTLLAKLYAWSAAGWLNREALEPVIDEIRQQARDLNRQLDNVTLVVYPRLDADRLQVLDFLLGSITRLSQRDIFIPGDSEDKARAELVAEREKLLIKLGQRKPVSITPPKPSPAPSTPSSSAAQPPAEKVPSFTPAPAPLQPPPKPTAPAIPLRDRFWRTLLSERTLQALLFLGIFLLFSAAISFVFWGWKDFSAPLRVAIPSFFTLIFLALGWYVRTQTRMYRSGIALTAIAALLIPIDFYTLYVNFNIAPEDTPIFWFMTSLVCLVAYIAIALLTRSGLFGYLVGAAAGGAVLSLVEIGNQHIALARDWDPAALSLLAAVLIVIATGLERGRNPVPSETRSLQENGFLLRCRVLAEPFRNLALIAIGAIMLLSFGWRYIGRSTYDSLHYSMTISWWLGGFLFGWGAIHYRSRTLGILAALTLPVATFMAQAALFNQAHISAAWHAFGLALLVPIYLTVGHRLLAHKDDRVLHGHGRTATGWSIALTVIAAFWSLTNLTSSGAAASTHAVLCAAMLLALFLWRNPRIVYVASLFAVTATAFAMTELNLSTNQYAVGWISLAIVHLVIAFRAGSSNGARAPTRNAQIVSAAVNAGFVIAALAVVSTLVPYNGEMLAYALGNWLGLAAWSARLAYEGRTGFASSGRLGNARFHWMVALPLPVWIWVLFANRGPLGYDLPLALSALAWGMVALSYRLRVSLRASGASEAISNTRLGFASVLNPHLAMTEYIPWYSIGLLVSMTAPISAMILARSGSTPAICLLASGLLYLADAITRRQRWELMPGALVTAWGLAWLLDHARVMFDAVSVVVALLVAVYVLTGLWMERRRSPVFTRQFLTPLYWASHALSGMVLLRLANSPLVALVYRRAWTTEMQWLGAASCILLGLVYACYAWGTFKEQWAHVAAWLFVAGGGLVAISHSTGSGSLVVHASVGAIAYIIAERALFGWWRYAQNRTRTVAPPARASANADKRKFLSFSALSAFSAIRWRRVPIIRLAWRLYHRPLLVAGWITSVAVIVMALVRNLVLLGGGRTQQTWAVVGLTLMVALYALSARLFRQARFAWFAAFLAFIPWTIMTNLGWLVAERPRTSAFAISWVVLAWLAYFVYWIVRRIAPLSYARPLRLLAHLLLPFSLLWGLADRDTSRVTFILAIALYAVEAWYDARQLNRDATIPPSPWRTSFLYPALGLVPVWCVYLLGLIPDLRHEHYGLMLLPFGVLGLVAGQWLERVAPRRALARSFGLPAYLTGYVATMVGTLLVAHDAGLAALVLICDALLMLVSAWLFKHPLWAFAAAGTAPLSFWLALNQGGIPGNRHGWWLLALAALYLLMAWVLRRARLAPYSTAPLTLAFALIAFALPPSSQDRVGAFWAYAGAAILYEIAAVWLRQPLLLTPACALVLVPYAVGLMESAVPRDYYGLALLPGAVIALAIGWLFDTRLGVWRDFPWGKPLEWWRAVAERCLNWWALPLYALGFVLALASPFFTSRPGLAALSCLLVMPLGVWAIYRFRLRVWLFATAVAGHLAAFLCLYDWGWWRYPADLGLRFLVVTIITAIVALAIERWRKETPPIRLKGNFAGGWSSPLYLLLLLDLLWVEASGRTSPLAGATISLTHALVIGVLASFWLSLELPYVSTLFGLVALVQWMMGQTGPAINAPIPLAQLALAYGLVGYGLTFVRERIALPHWLSIWDRALQRSGLWLSLIAIAAGVALGANIAQWTLRALFGLPFRSIVDMTTVQMVVAVLGLVGLLYLSAAFMHRRVRLGYGAVAMLLAAWMLHAFYVQQWDGATNIQWYALPAGLYLLGVSYLEWNGGSKDLARWIDYAAVVLMMGSLFWQTLLFGWNYAALLGAEGFAAFWWGSARRLRRFLYAGLMGVVLATVAQLINSLQSINQWLVFGIIGLIVVVAAILIERRIEDVKALRQTLETWE